MFVLRTYALRGHRKLLYTLLPLPDKAKKQVELFSAEVSLYPNVTVIVLVCPVFTLLHFTKVQVSLVQKLPPHCADTWGTGGILNLDTVGP
jgi:hypothetical protein